MDGPTLIACRECDTLHRKVALATMSTARCSRCNAVLYRRLSGSLERVLAVTLAAVITLVIANAFPIVELSSSGFTSQTTLIGAVVQLWGEQNKIVATVVLCSTFLFPLLELSTLLWLFVPLHFGQRPAGFAPLLRGAIALRPWGMIEVFMLGVLVALVKLSGIAHVIPEIALFAFAALTLFLAALGAFDLRLLWDLHDALPARTARPRYAGKPAR
jgi:paraquat-inducible protein A